MNQLKCKLKNYLKIQIAPSSRFDTSTYLGINISMTPGPWPRCNFWEAGISGQASRVVWPRGLGGARDWPPTGHRRVPPEALLRLMYHCRKAADPVWY